LQELFISVCIWLCTTVTRYSRQQFW